MLLKLVAKPNNVQKSLTWYWSEDTRNAILRKSLRTTMWQGGKPFVKLMGYPPGAVQIRSKVSLNLRHAACCGWLNWRNGASQAVWSPYDHEWVPGVIFYLNVIVPMPSLFLYRIRKYTTQVYFIEPHNEDTLNFLKRFWPFKALAILKTMRFLKLYFVVYLLISVLCVDISNRHRVW